MENEDYYNNKGSTFDKKLFGNELMSSNIVSGDTSFSMFTF